MVSLKLSVSTHNFIEEIGELIGQNELGTAIKKLSLLTQKSKLLDELILQSSRYNDVMGEIRKGTIDFSNADITKNQIRYALTDIMREIEENIPKNQALKTQLDEILGQDEEIQKAVGNQITVKGDNNTIIQDVKGSTLNINTPPKND